MSRADDLAQELDRAWAENRELKARLAATEHERDAARANAEHEANDVVALHAAVREWAEAHAAWDAWPSGAESAFSVHLRRERADDALRALVAAPKGGAL